MFKTARLKLTAWYLLIIMVISFSFSAIIYQLSSFEIIHFARSQRNRIETKFNSSCPSPPPPMSIDDDLVAESQQRLLVNLISINAIILIISGYLSYLLAGFALRPIQKMTEEQKQFISDASHELRTPITALKAMLEVSLRDKNLNLDESKKVLSDAILSTNQLKTLSDSLLELNRLTNNGLIINPTKISIKDLIINSVQKIKPKADKKNIKIIASPIKGKITVDIQKIEELFLIILDNAIKYSPKESQIKFTARQDRKNIIFKITDQGIGISSKDIPHIFDRFYRADNARTKNNSSGYGLGLSIAKKITEAHSGKIEVDSRLSHSTSFIIYLPNLS